MGVFEILQKNQYREFKNLFRENKQILDKLKKFFEKDGYTKQYAKIVNNSRPRGVGQTLRKSLLREEIKKISRIVEEIFPKMEGYDFRVFSHDNKKCTLVGSKTDGYYAHIKYIDDDEEKVVGIFDFNVADKYKEIKEYLNKNVAKPTFDNKNIKTGWKQQDTYKKLVENVEEKKRIHVASLLARALGVSKKEKIQFLQYVLSDIESAVSSYIPAGFSDSDISDSDSENSTLDPQQGTGDDSSFTDEFDSGEDIFNQQTVIQHKRFTPYDVNEDLINIFARFAEDILDHFDEKNKKTAKKLYMQLIFGFDEYYRLFDKRK